MTTTSDAEIPENETLVYFLVSSIDQAVQYFPDAHNSLEHVPDCIPHVHKQRDVNAQVEIK